MTLIIGLTILSAVATLKWSSAAQKLSKKDKVYLWLGGIVALTIVSPAKQELVAQSGSNHERKTDDWHVKAEWHGFMESQRKKRRGVCVLHSWSLSPVHFKNWGRICKSVNVQDMFIQTRSIRLLSAIYCTAFPEGAVAQWLLLYDRASMTVPSVT